MKHRFFVLLTAGSVLSMCLSVALLAHAKKVEGGDALVSWSGSGEVLPAGDGKEVINATLKGVMMVRHHKGSIRTPMHSAKMTCPVRVDSELKQNRRESVGICTIVAHEVRYLIYGQ